MFPVEFHSHLRMSLRRILPALSGLLLLWVFGFSMEAGAAENAVEPEALGTISGTVVTEASQPISGVIVTLYRSFEGFGWNPIRSTETDDGGVYVLPALRAGIYRLHFRDPQRRYAQEYYTNASTLNGATNIPIAGNDVSGIDVSLAPAAAISGTVSILDTLAPDSGYALLYAQVGPGWEPFTTTAILTPTGAYHFGELISGTYRICAYAFLGVDIYSDTFFGCYGGATPENARSIQVATGETRNDIDLSLGEGQYDGAITGMVTAEGVPLAGIQVSLYSYYIPNYPDPNYLPLVYTYTNEAGMYQLGGLQAGLYLVKFSDPEGDYTTRYYQDQRKAEQATYVPLPDGVTIRNIDANLARAGAINGRIRFLDRPVTPSYADLYWFTGEFWEWQPQLLQPDSAGNYTLKGLEPGLYRICFPFTVQLGHPYPISWLYYPNCYDTDRFSYLGYENATDILVVAGATASGVDFTVGPALSYAPAIYKQ
ncbi:MAG: hypothetical protein DCC55_14445 [Chloroflexi bacterium]|nr:MAG: hypothetical protein DCC55_14445 [Chloroflexota bacterium]